MTFAVTNVMTAEFSFARCGRMPLRTCSRATTACSLRRVARFSAAAVIRLSRRCLACCGLRTSCSCRNSPSYVIPRYSRSTSTPGSSSLTAASVGSSFPRARSPHTTSTAHTRQLSEAQPAHTIDPHEHMRHCTPASDVLRPHLVHAP